MEIFSNPIFIKVIIVIGVSVLCVGICWIVYIYGHRCGYEECMNNVRAKRRARRKPTQDSDIHVLKPVESRKHYTEAESVRIVARLEKEDPWI